MKKIIAMMMVTVLAIGVMVGCGSQKKSTVSKDGSTSVSTDGSTSMSKVI